MATALPIDICLSRSPNFRPKKSWRPGCGRPASTTYAGRRSRLASRRSTSAKSHEQSRPVTFDTLRAFIDALDGAGELARITRPVSLDRELCEIADRVMKRSDGGRALLFEHPVLLSGARSEFPVAINLFGSRQRMAMSLGVTDLDEIVRTAWVWFEKNPKGYV